MPRHSDADGVGKHDLVGLRSCQAGRQLDDALRSLTLRGASIDDIVRHASSAIHPIVADAAEKVLEGITTIEEAARVRYGMFPAMSGGL